MKSILLLLAIHGTAFAEALVSPESLLERPMTARLAEFKKLGFKAHKALEHIAFDRTQSLQIRWRAVTTMGKWDALQFRPQLDRALASKEWFMRNAALIALQNDERPRAIAWSQRMLEDKSLVVRTQAVRNLIELNASESEPLLWKEISNRRNFRKGESLWIRAHIAEALAHFAVQGRAQNFQKLLLDEDERLHKWALVGLETITGMRMSGKQEPLDVRRQKWLSRLESDTI